MGPGLRLTTSADDAQPLDQLLAQVAGGDAQAWRELVERYTPRVFGLLVRQAGDRELAEEITQATFVKIVTEIAGYQEQGRFESWLFRIAMNQLRDEMRRRKRHARAIDMSPGGERGESPSEWSAAQQRLTHLRSGADDDPLTRLDRQEQIQIMQLAVRQLDEKDQRLLHLRHTAGLTFAQIAELEELPLGTVLARGHRAMAKLRRLLLGNERDDDGDDD